MKQIIYKGISIEKLFPSGYYKFYSNKDKRHLYFDMLKDAKMYINEFWEQL